ncbi:tRNA lysidine(34) synthetase TilS [Aureibaculum sp. 2210JD6-5]|uniref:tRNA lysidine(34) synthetase TilS n=1 Tax=Aureibaculum sp. 2210JD6-5 TaxID=3103957 RepID=UPI002AAE7B89|nr:tRNA lysidine(34) synthetase TilS [Aureibaculum sp. 2210JD6-5]MDY7396499.1 tRNA lysidine(34) synthetase TilS [Aureibaculum sp. 2210JD6-5]
MLAQFSEHITTVFPELKDKKLLIAISGGLDSVVLTELLHKLDYNIALAHCNFQLRDLDSDQDEIFVNAMANRLQIPVFTKKFNTKTYAKKEKLSIQLAARELRYNWFNTLLRDHNLDYLLTAHHADDNLETFLINLSRGTGLDGLTGIPEQNEKTIRPLLPFSRNQIEKYALEHNLTWREDASNAETKYVRNKIRHEVIPTLKDINPQFLEAFSNTIQHLKETQQIIQESVEKTKQKVIISEKNGTVDLDIKALKNLKHTKAYLYELLKEYNFTAWNDIYDLLEAQSGKVVYSNTHRIIKNRGSLLVTALSTNDNNAYIIKEKGEHHFPTFSIKIYDDSRKFNDFENDIPPPSEGARGRSSEEARGKSFIMVDSDNIKFPLTIRKPQKGDYFYPLGMQGKKKLSKFFKDEKLSLLEKENVWVLVSEDKIIWVIDYRLDDRFKVADSTKKILKITVGANCIRPKTK